MRVLQVGNPKQLLFLYSRRGERLILVYEREPGTAQQNPPKLCLFVKGSSRCHSTIAFCFIDVPTSGLFS